MMSASPADTPSWPKPAYAPRSRLVAGRLNSTLTSVLLDLISAGTQGELMALPLRASFLLFFCLKRIAFITDWPPPESGLQLVRATSNSGSGSAVQSSAELKVQVSEREEAENKLERARAFFYAIIESLPGMLLVKTASDGNVVLVNNAAEALLGYDRSEIIGKTTIDLLPKQDAKSVLHQDKQALLKGKAVEDEYTLTTRKLGGSSVTNEEISSPRRAGKDEIHCDVC
jgi:PAS domain S-box-containing protein